MRVKHIHPEYTGDNARRQAIAAAEAECRSALEELRLKEDAGAAEAK